MGFKTTETLWEFSLEFSSADARMSTPNALPFFQVCNHTYVYTEMMQ